jgi:hypothetical protein
MPDGELITKLRHHVRAAHAATGQGIAPLRAALEVTPPGWYVGVKGADVVVTAREGVPEPAAPPVALITVADPLTALWVAPTSVRVNLTAPELTATFAPVAMTLTVELVAKAGGAPSPGRALVARGSGAPDVALPEVAGEPGTYRSASRVWTAAHVPLELRIGATVLARLTLDFTRADTRVRVVDPT